MINNQTLKNLYNIELKSTTSQKIEPKLKSPAVYCSVRFRSSARYALGILLCLFFSSSAFSNRALPDRLVTFTRSYNQTFKDRPLPSGLSLWGNIPAPAIQRAYSLACHLLHAGVPLKWIIDTTNAYRAATDFSASARIRYPIFY